MKMHDKAVIKIMRLRAALGAMRSATNVEKSKTALSALIDEVDKLPSIAADLFADEPVRHAVAGPRSFPFAQLQPGDHFDVGHDRVNSLRACASSFGRRHGMTLTVRELPNGGARCVRVDGVTGTPEPLVAVIEAKRKPAAPQPVHRPIQPAYTPSDEALDRPAPIPERTAFHVPHEDASIDDPQTADDVRACMAIPEDQRTDWQQFVVDEYQHLIEFEHARPPSSLILECVLAVGKANDGGPQASPRQEWIAHRFMNQMGWDAPPDDGDGAASAAA